MVRVSEIAWSDSMLDHIARHGVDPEEVEDVVFGTSFVTHGRERTYRFIGQTRGGRFLTVILARRGTSSFAVVTACGATDEERRSFRRR